MQTQVDGNGLVLNAHNVCYTDHMSHPSRSTTMQFTAGVRALASLCVRVAGVGITTITTTAT